MQLLMMSPADPAFWAENIRQTLQSYDEDLLRQVASKLIKPRSHWPVEELIERCTVALQDPAVIDRRLGDIDEIGRRLLAIIGHSRQPRWTMSNLLEILASLGSNEGPAQIIRLFAAGLLYPDLANRQPEAVLARAARARTLKSFDQWLTNGVDTGFACFAPPKVVERAIGTELGLPECPGEKLSSPSLHEADGLEWIVRLAALWQELAQAPLRCTQSGDFFKRDQERLASDPLLSARPADNLTDLPDPSLLTIALAEALGIIEFEQYEFRAGKLPTDWDGGLKPALLSMWKALPDLRSWNSREGWCGRPAGSNPYPSAYLLAILLLTRLAKEHWARPAEIEQWICEHHPFWRRPRKSSEVFTCEGWIEKFLLGFAYHLRLLQAAKSPDGGWLVRLSPWGEWMLGLAAEPKNDPAYPQTLLVQPNHEIIAYRQGLSPGLIARLSRIATWKSVGPACMLAVQAEQVYRALESGLSVEAILQTLEQHSSRAAPPAVVESLRTWANKRERLTVFPAATLFEFGSGEDLNEALARGIPGTRVADRLLAVTDESAVDFRHFRLTGTRDYGLPPEKCVDIEPDGVTLSVDVARSDLSLESELAHFAEPLDAATVNGRRRYQLTPGSLAAGREKGFGPEELEQWFLQRAGRPLSAAALLIHTGRQLAPLKVKRRTIVHVPSEELADGLQQWPATRGFIKARLGPESLVIDDAEADAFEEKLRTIGITLQVDSKQVDSRQ